VPYLFLTNDISDTVVNAVTVEGATSTQGVQAFSSSSVDQPQNCLAGSTSIQLADASFCRLDALTCGSLVRTVLPNGHIDHCAVDVIKTRLPGRHDAIEISCGGITVVCSPKHISLVPPQRLCGRDKLVCAKCGSRGHAYGCHPSCRLCSPVQAKGYVPVLACDLLMAGLHGGSVHKTIHQGYWYHLVLPPSNMSHAFILENGMLSEGFRHPLGSRKERDQAWAFVT